MLEVRSLDQILRLAHFEVQSPLIVHEAAGIAVKILGTLSPNLVLLRELSLLLRLSVHLSDADELISVPGIVRQVKAATFVEALERGGTLAVVLATTAFREF